MIIQVPTMNHSTFSIEASASYEAPTPEVVPSHDLRKVGLQSATTRLNASAGDLDVVFEARARADVVYCPFCPEPHPA